MSGQFRFSRAFLSATLACYTAFIGSAQAAVTQAPSLRGSGTLMRASDMRSVQSSSQAETHFKVSISGTTTGGAIDNSLLGLSYGYNNVRNGFFSPTNTGLVALFKDMGPGVLRICADIGLSGGTKNGYYGVTPAAHMQEFAGFLSQTGWKVIYGITLDNSTSKIAAAEAAEARKYLGANLIGYEIGNEPDHYAGRKRPASYTVNDFMKEWETYRSAILESDAAARFYGPVTAGNLRTFTETFIEHESARLSVIDFHHYRGPASAATMSSLLKVDTSVKNVAGDLKGFAQNTVPVRLAETNSFYDGGAPGISNSAGSALYGIDEMFQVALADTLGANFNSGGGLVYSPLADNGKVITKVKPLFDGLVFFKTGAVGTKILNISTTPTNSNVSIYSTLSDIGRINTIVLNKNATAKINVTIEYHKTLDRVKTLTMQASSLGSLSDLAIGGSRIGTDGSWNPTWSPFDRVSGTTYSIDVPPATAVIIHAAVF